MNQTQLFESTPEGKRRSVLFSIAIMTGFITIAAGAAAYVGTSQPAIAVVLGLIGVGAVAFAVLVYVGHLGGLVEQDQMLWQFTE
jgi:hypothetical protein